MNVFSKLKGSASFFVHSAGLALKSGVKKSVPLLVAGGLGGGIVFANNLYPEEFAKVSRLAQKAIIDAEHKGAEHKGPEVVMTPPTVVAEPDLPTEEPIKHVAERNFRNIVSKERGNDVVISRAVGKAVKEMDALLIELNKKSEELERLYNSASTNDSKIDNLIHEILEKRQKLDEIYSKVRPIIYNSNANLEKNALIREKQVCSRARDCLSNICSQAGTYRNRLEMKRAFFHLNKACDALDEADKKWEKLKTARGETSPELKSQTEVLKQVLSELTSKYEHVQQEMKQSYVRENNQEQGRREEVLKYAMDEISSVKRKIDRHEIKIADDAVFKKLEEQTRALSEADGAWFQSLEGSSQEVEVAEGKLKEVIEGLSRVVEEGQGVVGRSEDPSLQKQRRAMISNALAIKLRVINQLELTTNPVDKELEFKKAPRTWSRFIGDSAVLIGKIAVIGGIGFAVGAYYRR